jgi:hypothetical protein
MGRVRLNAIVFILMLKIKENKFAETRLDSRLVLWNQSYDADD